MKTIKIIFGSILFLLFCACLTYFIYWSVKYWQNNTLMNHTPKNSEWMQLYDKSWVLYGNLTYGICSVLMSAFICSVSIGIMFGKK